jgi:hypothetical protein
MSKKHILLIILSLIDCYLTIYLLGDKKTTAYELNPIANWLSIQFGRAILVVWKGFGLSIYFTAIYLLHKLGRASAVNKLAITICVLQGVIVIYSLWLMFLVYSQE